MIDENFLNINKMHFHTKIEQTEKMAEKRTKNQEPRTKSQDRGSESGR
jgi:hypothetical protein